MHTHWATVHVLHRDCTVHLTPFLQALLLQFGDSLSVFVVCTRKPLLKGNLKKSSTLSQRKGKVRYILLVLIWITVQLEDFYFSPPLI